MLKLPIKFIRILEKDQEIYGIVNTNIARFSEILLENKLEFFEEFTDHGIRHIESVLEVCSELIAVDAYDILNSTDIAILVLAVVLHDIGMHTSFNMLKGMIEGKYDCHFIADFDDKTWGELWIEYIKEAKRFSKLQKEQIFGNGDYKINIPNFSNKDQLTGSDKKLVGEFIRRNHPRLSHEIASYGILTSKGDLLRFADTSSYNNSDFFNLVGIVARSHGIELRRTFGYLKEISAGNWQHPYNTQIVFLMVVLRIADYFQISDNRLYKNTLKLKEFSSPVSELEHKKHEAVKFTGVSQLDEETFYIEAHPQTNYIYIKLKNLFKDIQHELDVSWAVLGEIYGKEKGLKPNIRYRRIESNIDEKHEYLKKLPFIPGEIAFSVDDELSKLLIAPLYGDHPTFGIRELLQNSIDACLEREKYSEIKALQYIPEIKIDIYESKGNEYYFEIIDNGKGISYFEIKNYFLKVGASFKNSLDWNILFKDEDGNAMVNRTGRFGIGVLAAFLIGNEIEVTTHSLMENKCYKFSTDFNLSNIEILKSKELSSGTKIKIKITKEKYNEISNINYNEEYGGKSNWMMWHCSTYPTIRYIINGEEKKLNNFPLNPDFRKYLPIKFFQFQPKGFNSTVWTYENTYNNSILTCNNIRIPFGYKFHNKSTESLIYKEPKINVYDGLGNLNLSLNRNQLFPPILIFEKELKTEIYKHIIVKLINFKPHIIIKDDKVKILSSDFFIHPSFHYICPFRIYFTRDGFFPNFFPDLLNVLKDKYIYIYKFDTNNAPEEFEIDKHMKIIDVHLADDKGRSYYNVGDSFFKILQTKAIRSIQKDSPINNINLNKGNINFDINKYAAKNEWIEKLYEAYVWSICEEEKDIISDIFYKYFGGSFIIPYSMHDRSNLSKIVNESLQQFI